MIRVFRNIRKRLAAENEIAAYSRYAIGEIFLVVAGILIALQINTWNENHSKHIQEVAYLQNLKEDLVTQMDNLDSYIEFQDIIIRNSNEIVNHFNSNPDFRHLDSIYVKLNDLAVRITFINSNTTLIELVNSGEINLISNEALRRELLEFNNALITAMNITQNNNTNLIDRLIVPQITTYFGSVGYSNSLYEFIQREFGQNDDYPKAESHIEMMDESINESKFKLELMNSVVFRRGIASSHRSNNVYLRERAEKLIIEINEELENL